MKEFIRVMKALSDPGRVKIVKMLAEKAMCVCEIRAVLGLAQPTVSKHLRILEEAGLVKAEKDKLWVNYSLEDCPASPYAACLLEQLATWLDDEPEIKNMKALLPTIDRATICQF